MYTIQFDSVLSGTSEQRDLICKRLKQYKQGVVGLALISCVLGFVLSLVFRNFLFFEMAAICVVASIYILVVRMRNEKKRTVVVVDAHCIEKKRSGYRLQNTKYTFTADDNNEKVTFSITVSRSQLFAKDGDYTLAFFKIPQADIDSGALPYSEKNIICKI